MPNFKRFLLSNMMPIIAWTLAIISMIIVPIDSQYTNYFNIKTLVTLFTIMLIVGALKNTDVFSAAAKIMITKLKNTRAVMTVLIFITYISSIFIANDIALLTFLPLTIAVFNYSKQEKYIAITIIMQTVAANLGGMIMPFGNPQSLYIFNFYNLTLSQFLSAMLLPTLYSLTLIILVCCFLPKKEIIIMETENNVLPVKKLIIYGIIFVIALLAVFNIISFYISLIITAIVIFIMDKRAFLKADYGLLLTFVAFFILANNLARIDSIRQFLINAVNSNTMLISIISCQFISNVPTGIFLSNFTSNWKSLLIGVNIAGVGTPVSSLASLITLKTYTKKYPEDIKRYLLIFAIVNISFLLILSLLCLFTI